MHYVITTELLSSTHMDQEERIDYFHEIRRASPGPVVCTEDREVIRSLVKYPRIIYIHPISILNSNNRYYDDSSPSFDWQSYGVIMQLINNLMASHCRNSLVIDDHPQAEICDQFHEACTLDPCDDDPFPPQILGSVHLVNLILIRNKNHNQHKRVSWSSSK